MFTLLFSKLSEFKNLQCCGCGQAFSIPFKFIFTIKTAGLTLFSQDLTLILLPNCYLFPCMLVTRIWVYMKGKKHPLPDKFEYSYYLFAR